MAMPLQRGHACFKPALAERDQALADVEVEVPQAVLKTARITWNIRRFTLEQARGGIEDLDAKIAEAKVVENEAFRRLNSDSTEEEPEDYESESD
ncbi:hypothetical protein RND71_041648 [Anisodus tanguticus]|uniref:Uncharacterized protein n=1 Tax=Anisodus tanguticus TaxID=243964 RepID=A0AAE1QVM7_9SOLA|nr:hypothetical protein RND71_041648 [Anisodus tanguticus]